MLFSVSLQVDSWKGKRYLIWNVYLLYKSTNVLDIYLVKYSWHRNGLEGKLFAKALPHNVFVDIWNYRYI